jgi:hypothetical protein
MESVDSTALDVAGDEAIDESTGVIRLCILDALERLGKTCAAAFLMMIGAAASGAAFDACCGDRSPRIQREEGGGEGRAMGAMALLFRFAS